ncbi:MAG: OmpA family protein, partial [Bacteroidota bacterium]
LGPLVNGPGSEYYFTMDARSKEIFFSRSEQAGPNTDLFSFPMPMEAQPLAVTRFSGTVTDSTGAPTYGIVSITDLDGGIEIAPKYLREDGTFDFDLINNRNYLLVVEGDNFFRLEEEFLLQGAMQVEKKVQPFESKIAFNSLEFEHNRAEILPAMEADLEKLGNFLKDHPELRLEISGHTDLAGNADANLKLSTDRAQAIRLYLIDRYGIQPDRITAKGYGSSRPVVQPEVSDRDRQTNRRVEFSLSRPD